MNLIRKYWLLEVLFILVLILIFLKIKYSNNSLKEENKNNNNNVPTEIVSINNQQTNVVIDENNITDTEENQSELTADIKNTDGLSPFLPYQGKYFRVERYINPNYLEVIVKNNTDLNEVTKELEPWMKEYGADPQKTKYAFVFE